MAFTLRPATPQDGSAVLTDDLIYQHVKPASDADRLLIGVLRDTAIDLVEGFTAIGLTRRAWRLSIDSIAPFVSLGRQPVASVTAVGYQGIDGLPVVFPAMPVPDDAGMLSTAAWPAMASGARLTITFQAGYAVPDDVPPPLRTAALLMLRHLYDGETGNQPPATVLAICDQFRVPGVD